MEKDTNSKYWGYMEQNEAVKDTIQPGIGVGKDIILLIYERNVSKAHDRSENYARTFYQFYYLTVFL